MTVVTYGEYIQDLINFTDKHNKKAECKVHTSPMVNNWYHKEYCWSDGATFYEVNAIVTETVKVTVHGVKMDVDVTLWKTEYWSSEFGSKYYYQKI